ncbi:hypothetical protein ACXR2U_09720 [Jatrophihabitans sp. YIM 134969]
MTGFDLDPTTFPKVAAVLDQQRAALASHTDAVRATTGSGNPWGGDKQGSAFGQIYADVLDHVTDVMANHGELLSYASTQLTSWADDAVATDDQVAGRLNALGGGPA